MPFVRGDLEAFDEYAEELGLDESQRPSGAFEYVPPQDFGVEPRPLGDDAAASAGRMTAVARVARDALAAIGAARFRVRYDGGHDEGFAHADAVFLADGAGRPIEDVAGELAAAGVAASARAAAAGGPGASHWHDGGAYYAGLDDDAAVRAAIDELADAAAAALLGEGYGTGEYTMYGALTLELSSGAVADDPAAPRPPDVDLD